MSITSGLNSWCNAPNRDNTCRDDSFLTLMVVSNGKLLLGFICKLHEALHYIVNMHASLVKYWGQAEK